MSPGYSNVTSSIHRFDYTICITQSQIHLFNQHKELQAPQSFYQRVKTKTCANPYAYVHKVTEPASWSPEHTSSGSLEYPIVTMGIPRKTYIKCFQIHNSIQSDNSETSKVKLNSSQEDRGGETPYDPTIRTKLAVQQDRANSRTRERERERERDQTHSYWYIPSAPRVNYFLLIIESAGMMKMAIGDGFPLR